ncbi:MAG: CDP-2,3-bis-(O-geranylgeranyl)-sn-glycerol synthase [Parcubacteria group bacterium]
MIGLLLLQSLWLFLPAGLANMTPVLVKRIDILNIPIDGGKTYRGKSLLGRNKTYRGLVFGVLVAILTALIQDYLAGKYDSFYQITLAPFDQYGFVVVGFLLGFGALFGDLVESFIKRRVNIGPGEKLIPWDQLDFVIGSLLFLGFIYLADWPVIICLVLVVPFFHIGTNFLGYYLGIKKSKW